MSRKEHGHVDAVSREKLGDTLDVDAASGATTLVVGDVTDFDELGGSLVINGAVLPYLTCDDELGTVTLTSGLPAAAEAGEPVLVWDTYRLTAATEHIAQVVIDGDDEGDPIEASIASHLVYRLPGGIRALVGESVLMEEEDDEWRVIDVLGIEDSSPVKFYQDTFTLTVAGAQDLQLTYDPIVHSEHVYWNGLYQPQVTAWTRAEKTVSILGTEALVGDVVTVEYAYLNGAASPSSSGEIEILPYESAGWKYLVVSEADTTNRSAVGFDDSAWSVGPGAFAAAYIQSEYGPLGWPVQSTTLPSEDTGLWLRRIITCPFGTTAVTIPIRVDGNVWVYWDGVLLGNSGDTPPGNLYSPTVATDAGDHVLAIRFLDDVHDPALDGAYVDAQVVATVED